MFSSKPPIKPSRVSVTFDSKSQNDDLRSIFDFASAPVKASTSIKRYVILFPNDSTGGQLIDLFIWLGRTAYHKLSYESIYNCSVNDAIKFFDSLESAQCYCNDHLTKFRKFDYIPRSVIVELEFENDKIAHIKKLYQTGKKLETLTKSVPVERHGQTLFKQKTIQMFIWKEIKLTSKDFSHNAIAELNKQYGLKNNNGKIKLQSKL